MNELKCWRCLNAPHAVGPVHASPAITVFGGEALCLMHARKAAEEAKVQP